jgi:hypothetical protein
VWNIAERLEKKKVYPLLASFSSLFFSFSSVFLAQDLVLLQAYICPQWGLLIKSLFCWKLIFVLDVWKLHFVVIIILFYKGANINLVFSPLATQTNYITDATSFILSHSLFLSFSLYTHSSSLFLLNYLLQYVDLATRRRDFFVLSGRIWLTVNIT